MHNYNKIEALKLLSISLADRHQPAQRNLRPVCVAARTNTRMSLSCVDMNYRNNYPSFAEEEVVACLCKSLGSVSTITQRKKNRLLPMLTTTFVEVLNAFLSPAVTFSSSLSLSEHDEKR